MPYILPEKRATLDPTIDAVRLALSNLELDDDQNNTEGNLNYIITALLVAVYGNSSQARYSKVNDMIGMLECCKLELYRKYAAPYEDQKEFDNGPVVMGLNHLL